MSKAKDEKIREVYIYFTEQPNEDVVKSDKEQNEIGKESEIRKKYCHHEWGTIHWTWSCGGYRQCVLCGKIEDYYERD